jgi:hypothetical protein
MLELFPPATAGNAARLTVRAAIDVYDLLNEDVKKLNESKEQADVAKAKELTRKMATYLEFANLNASTPTVGNMRRESQLWKELEDWPKAEALLKKIQAKFETGPDADSVKNFILPDLAVALYRQQKMQEAADLLAPMVDEKRATAALTLIYARAIAGYAEQVVEEGKPRTMHVVPGLGGVENFTKAAELFGKLLETEKNSGAGAWRPEWLRIKFDQIYCLHLWSKLDSKRTESREAQMKLVQTEFGGPDFSSLQDAETRAMYIWLTGQMK